MTNLGLIVYMAFVLWKTPWGAISLHQCAVEKRARLHSFAFELGACRFSSFLFFIQSLVFCFLLFCCICSCCCRNFSSCVAIFRFSPPCFLPFFVSSCLVCMMDFGFVRSGVSRDFRGCSSMEEEGGILLVLVC